MVTAPIRAPFPEGDRFERDLFDERCRHDDAALGRAPSPPVTAQELQPVSSSSSSFSIARNTREQLAADQHPVLVGAAAGVHRGERSPRSNPVDGPSPTGVGAPSIPPDGEGPLPLRFLLDIAEGLATVDDVWRPYLHDDLSERPATRLLASDRWEAWLLEWGAGQSVELHDHGSSAGAFTVVLGSLIEVRAPGVAAEGIQRSEARAGSSRSFRAGARHDVLNLSPAPAASIHVYSPPLQSMTFFDPITLESVRTEAVESTPAVLGGGPVPQLHPSHHR
jgi:hypothetical protein